MDPRFDDFEKRISALERALKGKKAAAAEKPTTAPKAAAKKGKK